MFKYISKKMAFKKYAYSAAAIVLLQASGAMAITIQNPTANKVIDKSHLTVEVNGACKAGAIYKISAKDSANKATSEVWTQCQPWGFSVQVNLSALKDGNITVQALQDAKRNPELSTVNIVKNTGTVVTPPVTPPKPSPSPSPTVTPKPSPSPSPTVPPVASSGIVIGVGGHDGRQAYPLSQSEAVFKLLDSKNIRSYRIDADPRNYTLLDEMVRLGKKYHITIRPMIYPINQEIAYTLAKRYINDIKVWEINNEQDSSKSGAQERINAMVAMYKGIKQASDETGAGLKTTINVMSCNSDDVSATARCPNDKLGSMWFLDMAKASGFNFDYISFHYYPFYQDGQGNRYWMNMYLSQMRAMSVKYKTKIFYNEMHCAEIYKGSTDGGYPGDKGCYDSVKQMFDILRADYSDVVAEINMYELFDEPEQSGVEAHFGLMYNINSPKPTFNLVSEYANKK